MATTHRLTNVIKIVEFPDLYASFSTMRKSEQCYWNVIDLIQKQTEAKQAKWWAYYDARQSEKVGCIMKTVDLEQFAIDAHKGTGFTFNTYHTMFHYVNHRYFGGTLYNQIKNGQITVDELVSVMKAAM